MVGAREVFHWVLWGVLVTHRFSSPDSGSGVGALEVVDWAPWGVLVPPQTLHPAAQPPIPRPRRSRPTPIHALATPPPLSIVTVRGIC